jgi:hypothetical protein
VLANLRELGIAEADINAPDLGIHPQYDYRKGQQLTGYRVVRQMAVKVRDLDALGGVLDGVVGAGANEVQGTRMTASDPSTAEHEALRAAIGAARAKAEALAEAAGVTLGAVERIEEDPDRGGPPMARMGMMAMSESADASTEVVAGDLTVTRHIRARFAIS